MVFSPFDSFLYHHSGLPAATREAEAERAGRYPDLVPSPAPGRPNGCYIRDSCLRGVLGNKVNANDRQSIADGHPQGLEQPAARGSPSYDPIIRNARRFPGSRRQTGMATLSRSAPRGKTDTTNTGERDLRDGRQRRGTMRHESCAFSRAGKRDASES